MLNLSILDYRSVNILFIAFTFILVFTVPVFFFFFLKHPAPPEIYPLPLPAALPICTRCNFTQPGDRQNADPKLGPLQLNAPGSTPTHALLSGSPAIDAVTANPAACPATDQRGLSDRKSTRLNSSHSQISYAVFCLKK